MDSIPLAMAVLVTSTISGMLGMGGGMILMGILLLFLPLEWAMVLHGCVQLSSNGSRAVIHRRSVNWRFLPRYLLGAVLAYALFTYLAWAPSKGLAFVALGCLPLVARFRGLGERLNINGFATGTACGAVVLGAQVMAGASGPALDVFFLGARLDRFSTIATKAVTQTFSHLLKIAYFSSILFGSILAVSRESIAAESMPFSPWLIPGLVAVAPVGSYLGRLVLDHLSDRRFLAMTRWVASGIGVIWVLRGVHLLMVG
ncbi:MAG: TSUP family transporter [Gemmatimonadetes bacterium]|jgi:uncharacterized membrane protein YfcA|nr:TSUP family transporter [Gemmatimonadota bacterium]MBT5059770.1 TSUP family transporter [Gemmatimonadota bacterium]MBT5143034.1 TSUP family transporter [Gemmatimonadota bacterium]MBT5588300.1 TSUP family transporter [Gemmatimonadota bacterium]MBT5962699.1 TSUP family transporter [Gemmatimonadota bacterium]